MKPSYYDIGKPDPKKDFQRNVLVYVIGLIIVGVFAYILDFLLHPFTRNEKADDKALDKKLEGIKKRQAARDIRTEALAKDTSDPMNKFQAQCLNGKGCKKYLQWFNRWKAGRIIDSGLRWAPDIYDENGSMQINFLKYLKIQIKLHKRDFLGRVMFLSTVYRYYPEFTATWSGLIRDIAYYESIVMEENLNSELKNEIEIYGLPEEVAEYLADLDVTPNGLKKKAEFLKRCLTLGFNSDQAITMLETGVRPGSREADFMSLVSDKYDLPGKVGLALARQEITEEDISELGMTMKNAMNTYGLDIFSDVNKIGKSMYMDLLDYNLQNMREKNKLRTLERV